MYEDPSRWSLTLQTYIQLTMLEHHKKETVSLLVGHNMEGLSMFYQHIFIIHVLYLLSIIYFTLATWFQNFTCIVISFLPGNYEISSLT